MWSAASRWVARVDALGAVAEQEVGPGDEPGPTLEIGATSSSVVPGIGRGLEDHRRPRREVGAERRCGRLDVAQVWRAIAQRRRHRDDRDIEACTCAGFGRRVQPPGLELRAEVLVRDVLDV